MTERFLAYLRVELAASPERWRAVARVVIACAVASTLVLTLRIPEGWWVLLTIFLFSQPNTGASVMRGIQRFLGTLVGAAFGIALCVLAPQQPWIMIPTTGIAVGVGIYLSRTSAAPYVPVLGVLTMVLAVGGVDVGPTEGVDETLQRLLNISLGNLIATASQLLLWPESSDKLLLDNLAQSLRYSAVRAEQPTLEATEVIADPTRLALSEERVMNSLGTWSVWLERAETSSSDLKAHHQDLVNLIGCVNRMGIASQQMAETAATSAREGTSLPLSESLYSVISEIRNRLIRYAEAIEGRQWTTSLDELPPLAPRLASRLAEIDRPRGQEVSAKESFAAATITASCESLAEALDELATSADCLRPHATRSAPPEPQVQRSTDWVPWRFGSLRGADVAASAKASLAVMITYFYANAIGWPGGLTAVVTVVLCSLDNYGAIIQKGALRVLGAATGGILSIAAIVTVMPNIDSLPAFLLLTSPLFAFASWLQNGSARISYAGLQTALAVTVCLFAGFGPTVDLEPIWNRLVGIFVGLGFLALTFAVFGEVRGRVWALGNAAETLRIMARAVAVGLGPDAPSPQDRPQQGYRFEIYRRIAFGYRLLAESSYEDWFSADRQAAAKELDSLRAVLDRVRTLQRIAMSLVWNRLQYQRISRPAFAGRHEVQDVGRTIPQALTTIADWLESPGHRDPNETAPSLAELADRLEAARAALESAAGTEVSDPQERDVRRRLASQLGFYHEFHEGLTRLISEAGALEFGSDQFSVAAWLRGSQRRTVAPTVRPT